MATVRTVALLAALGLATAAKRVPTPPPPPAAVPAPPTIKSGVEKWRAGDYAAAVAIWTPFAQSGDADALFNLGQAYKLGRGVTADPVAARDYYRKAATKGHLPAQANLGIALFQAGEKPEAIKWLRTAADRGEARAQYVLGIAAFNGDGVPRSASLGYGYLLRAQASGLPQAATALGGIAPGLSPADRTAGEAVAASLAAGTGVPAALATTSGPRSIGGPPTRSTLPVVTPPAVTGAPATPSAALATAIYPASRSTPSTAAPSAPGGSASGGPPATTAARPPAPGVAGVAAAVPPTAGAAAVRAPSSGAPAGLAGTSPPAGVAGGPLATGASAGRVATIAGPAAASRAAAGPTAVDRPALPPVPRPAPAMPLQQPTPAQADAAAQSASRDVERRDAGAMTRGETAETRNDAPPTIATVAIPASRPASGALPGQTASVRPAAVDPLAPKPSRVGPSAIAAVAPTGASAGPGADGSAGVGVNPTKSAAAAKPTAAPLRPFEVAVGDAPKKPDGWRVQLGAFSSRKLADAAWADVKATAAPAKPVFATDGPVTKLQMGPFASRDAAKAACTKLTAAGRACFVTAG